MGQSKTEYACRRRQEREGRQNSFAVLNENTGMVLIFGNATNSDVTFEAEGVIHNVTRTYEVAKARSDVCGPITVQFSQQFVSYLMQNEHLDRDRAGTIPLEKAMASPLLSVGEKGRGVMMIDGQHRAYRMYLAGISSFLTYAVPPKLLPPFVTRRLVHKSECSPEILALTGLVSENEMMKGISEYTAERKMKVEEVIERGMMDVAETYRSRNR